MTDALIAILLSMAPVAEIRGGIPYAILSGIHPVTAFIICALANIAMVPIIWVLLNLMHYVLERIPWLRKHVDFFLHRAQRKVHAKVEKYGYVGLAIFVAIPLPVTGAWTGSIGAWALGMRKLPAFISIACGVLIASTIVTAIVLSGSAAFNWILAV